MLLHALRQVKVLSNHLYEVLLTAWTNVTEIHSHTGINSEAPRPFHLPPRVPAEVVPSSELRVLHRWQVMAVRVLGSPWLAVVSRLGYADSASVISTTAIIAAVICGRIFHKVWKLEERNIQPLQNHCPKLRNCSQYDITLWCYTNTNKWM